MTEVQSKQYPVLTPNDRCDRCGAQAYVRAVLYDELLFCGHHGTKYEGIMVSDGWRIVTDNRGDLVGSP